MTSYRPCFDEYDVPPLDYEVAVEASKPDDVRVDVVDQADLEQGGGAVWKRRETIA